MSRITALILLTITALLQCSFIHADTNIPKVKIVYAAMTEPYSFTPRNSPSYFVTAGRCDLFLLDTSQPGKPIRLTNAESMPGNATRHPAFSPDGGKVAFASTPHHSNDLDFLSSPLFRKCGIELWTVDVNSKNVTRVTSTGAGYDHPMWSPDGKSLAAVQTCSPPWNQLLTWYLPANKPHLLLKGGKQYDITDAFWSGDSSYVYCQVWVNGDHDPNLYQVPRAGGKRELVIKGRDDSTNYSFSPDGKKVAYTSDLGLHLIDLNSKDRILVAPLSKISRPSWSYDSTKLVAIERVDNISIIHIYNTITSGQSEVTRIPQRPAPVGALSYRSELGDARWSRDGKWILISTSEHGSTEEENPATGIHTFDREGLIAVSVEDKKVVTLMEPTEETYGLDWFEEVNGDAEKQTQMDRQVDMAAGKTGD